MTLNSNAPVLLAIDTCTSRASIALRDAHTVRAEMTWECRRHETALVSSRIKDLMTACRIPPAEIGAVAVAIGPGSFTGVRCGLAIAKGMAVALGIPLIGVTAFDVIARQQPMHMNRTPMLALVEAGRNRVAACRYEWQEGMPAVAGDWWIQAFPELSAAIESPMIVCGDIAPALATLLQEKAELAPATLNLRRAGFLAELAYARWQRNEVDNAITLTAIYPAEA
jgi:tRNA threonylcarbamoyladenosine biosynthesis protein TsaB